MSIAELVAAWIRRNEGRLFFDPDDAGDVAALVSEESFATLVAANSDLPRHFQDPTRRGRADSPYNIVVYLLSGRPSDAVLGPDTEWEGTLSVNARFGDSGRLQNKWMGAISSMGLLLPRINALWPEDSGQRITQLNPQPNDLAQDIVAATLERSIQVPFEYRTETNPYRLGL